MHLFVDRVRAFKRFVQEAGDEVTFLLDLLNRMKNHKAKSGDILQTRAQQAAALLMPQRLAL